ncbi:unnamed protein product [Calypogeia fissa]
MERPTLQSSKETKTIGTGRGHHPGPSRATPGAAVQTAKGKKKQTQSPNPPWAGPPSRSGAGEQRNAGAETKSKSLHCRQNLVKVSKGRTWVCVLDLGLHDGRKRGGAIGGRHLTPRQAELSKAAAGPSEARPNRSTRKAKEVLVGRAHTGAGRSTKGDHKQKAGGRDQQELRAYQQLQYCRGGKKEKAMGSEW